MSEDLVKYCLSAGFVTSRVWPWPSELAYGWRSGWIDSSTLVEIAEQEVCADLKLPAALTKLALLLQDEYSEIPDLVRELGDVDEIKSRRVWLYLALAWLFTNRKRCKDPLKTIEMLYADFGYPEDIKGIVRFMPATPGTPTGTEAIIARWASYLESRARVYAKRKWQLE